MYICVCCYVCFRYICICCILVCWYIYQCVYLYYMFLAIPACAQGLLLTTFKNQFHLASWDHTKYGGMNLDLYMFYDGLWSRMCMYINVCWCVVYEWLCVSVHWPIYVFISTQLCIYAHVRICLDMHFVCDNCVYVVMCVHKCLLCCILFVCIFAYLSMSAYGYVVPKCLHKWRYFIYVFVYMHRPVFMCVCMYISLCICIYITVYILPICVSVFLF